MRSESHDGHVFDPILLWKEKIDGNYLNNYPDPSAHRSVAGLGWGYSSGWGRGPSGLLGLILVVVIALFLMGRI
jgi:hypothetical protein